MCNKPIRSIEDLPEDVLSIIMSKFSIKEGLRASLTCKQWLSLPTCLSEITFDTLTMASGDTQLGEDDRDLFIERVNRFLEQYGKSLSRRMPLSAFRIAFWLDRNSATGINSWIEFALSNGVRVLEVVLRPDYKEKDKHNCIVPDGEIYVFPCDLLNRPRITLEKLWLVSCVFGRNLNTKLTSLKELELWSTTLTEADMRNIHTYCTSLTRLTFNFCALPEKLIVGGSFLAYLKVQWCTGVSEIELSDGRAMTCFIYQGNFIKFTKFCEAPKLTDVQFNICDVEWVGFCMSKVLHLDFPAMQNLVLCGTRPPLSLKPDAFCRLEVLKLFNSGYSSFSLLSVLKLLRACPLLRSFEVVPPFRCQGGKDVNVRLPIQAFHNSLKIVEIGDFSCSKEQVELVSMIIQASGLLNQVTIICVRKDHKEFQGIQKMKLAKSIFIRLMQSRTLIFR